MRQQTPEEFLEIPAQSFGRVSIVMQVNLDLAKALPPKIDEPLNVLGPVFLRWEKKAVARRKSVGIRAPGTQARIVIRPAGDPPTFCFQVSSIPARFKMIGKTEHHVDRAWRPTWRTSGNLTRVVPPPDVDIAVQEPEQDRKAVSEGCETDCARNGCWNVQLCLDASCLGRGAPQSEYMRS